jgi:hypothetical protein
MSSEALLALKWVGAVAAVFVIAVVLYLGGVISIYILAGILKLLGAT